VAKAAKIDDVKHPDKVTPSATARPLIVTNHSSVANDPMVTSGTEKRNDAPSTLASHTIKAITPPDDLLKTQDSSSSGSSTSNDTTQATTEADTAEVRDIADEIRDPDAMQAAEDAAAAEAKAKRDAELEATIVSGQYAVPINAVQRRRSQVTTVTLCVLTIVLLLILLDAVADAGILKLPSSVPHTHFFSNK